MKKNKSSQNLYKFELGVQRIHYQKPYCMYQSRKQSSPNHNGSEFNESPEQQMLESLQKYINLPFQENYTDKLKKEIIVAEIQSINSDLSTICKERFGDLTTGGDKAEHQWNEIQKTIKLTKSLVSYIHKESETKKQLTIKIRRLDEEIAKQSSINQKITKQKRNLQKEKQSLELKSKSLERQFKEDIQKIKKDKEESEKKFFQISNKENQYKNEMRKNQQIIAQLQEKIKNKVSNKIDQAQVKNRFEIIEEVKNYGPSLILTNSQNQFNKFFMNNFETKHRMIVEENEYLKQCLKNMYKQLHELLEVKREIIQRRKGYESALESDVFDLETLKPETFNLPKEYSEDSIERLNQNLHKFKEALKINELVNDKVYDQKVRCINNVKNLLGNYKEIVQSQDKLINRVVLKSKQFKSNEMSNIDNKYSRLEEDQLQKSKRFLEEQREILLNRNKELELTRKAMKNTIRKAEEEKKMFNKKKIQTNEQLQILKKNIQKLPVMVEQQISNMI